MEYEEPKPMHPGQVAIINAAQNALNGQAEIERKAALFDELLEALENMIAAAIGYEASLKRPESGHAKVVRAKIEEAKAAIKKAETAKG